MKYNIYKLGDVTTFIDYRGKTPPKKSHGIPLITAKIIKNGFIQPPQEFIDETYYDEWMRRGIPKKGDIVFTTEAPLGEVAQIKTNDKMAFAQRIIILQSDMRVLDNTYLFYALQDNTLKNRINSRKTGTTVTGIKSSELKKIVIELPDINTQKAIATTLSYLDDKIELNNRINNRLEKIAQAIFNSWLVDFEPSKPFTKIVRVLGGGTPKTGISEYWNGSIPFFTPKDALSTYTMVTEKTLTEAGLSNCNSQLYPTNTVFVTARGTVGKLSLAGRPMAMNQSCYALIGNDGFGQYFIYHLAQYVIESLKNKASGAVFDAIVTRDFESELVPVIPIEEVRSFEEKVAPIYEAILNNSNESIRLSELRDTLLLRLMSGELSVTDLGNDR
jgi:Restriction endonuclease S subunits